MTEKEREMQSSCSSNLEPHHLTSMALFMEHFRSPKWVLFLGCCHSSVDSSAPSIMLPQVRVPSTPSMLFSIYIKFKLYNCNLNWNVKRTNINKKRPIGPFLTKLGGYLWGRVCCSVGRAVAFKSRGNAV